MRDCLSIELILGVLLVTSFTTSGLIALWAATSTRHWFLRTAVILITLSPLLAVPAYEPFLIFALQACVIVTGVQCWPSISRRIQITEALIPTGAKQSKPSALRFLLRVLLLATPVVAGIALLSPLVQFPVWGPVLIFALEAGAILACAAVWVAVVQLGSAIRRHRMAITTEKVPPTDLDQTTPTPGLQFSLQTLLLLTPLIAVLVAIGAKMWATLGHQSVESITTIALDGTASGIVVLLAAWIAVSRRKKVVWPCALVCCFGTAVVLAYFEWLFESFSKTSGWPPTPSLLAALIGPRETHPQLAWFVLLPAILLLTLLAIVLFRISTPTASGNRQSSRSSGALSRGVLATLFIALSVVPASFLWLLLHRSPLPQIALPNPNGLDQIVVAGNAFNVSPILNLSREPKSTAELAAEMAKYQSAYDELHVGLSRDIRVHDWSKMVDLAKSFDLSFELIQTARSAARGLLREAELAQQQRRFDDAIRLAFDNMRLGLAIPHDGMLVDYLVGLAIEGIGHDALYQSIADLDPSQCRSAIAMLQNLEADRESIEHSLQLDRIWSQHAFGWYGHLCQIFDDIAPRWDTVGGVREALHRTQAVSRLLTIELAIRAYSVDHESLPDTLNALVPKYLAQIPVDPFDPTGGPLRYTRTDTGHFIYSVGVDRTDNGGKSTEQSSGTYGTGEDLRLDVRMRPEEPAPVNNNGSTTDGTEGVATGATTDDNTTADTNSDSDRSEK